MEGDKKDYFWLILGYPGVPGPPGSTKWWGKVVAFGSLFSSQMWFILTELC